MKQTELIKKMRKYLTLIIIIVISIFLINIVFAANDPGHDTLYIEQQGDSELNGSLNITANQTIKGGRQALINYLDIYFNGQTILSPSIPTIAGTTNDLYLDSKAGGNVYINSMANTGTVFIGSTGDTVNLNITGALYFVNDRLATSSGSTANNNLYWGDKLLCNASQTNCGWVTSATGGGDITAVYTTDGWLSGGGEFGDISLLFNESKLNNTIDARASSLGDGNNYTQNIAFNRTNDIVELTLNRSNMPNLTASFTDYNNYTISIGFTGATLNLNRSNMANLTATIPDNSIKLNAYNITAGTFNTGLYTFQNNVTFNQNITVTNCIVFASGGKICSGS